MAQKIDPLAYLKEIKGSIQLGSEVYEGFINLMLDFQDQRVCTDDLLAGIRELFKGHKALISGFNDFLPEDYQIILSDDEIALSFVNKVKARFWDDHQGFESFIHILDMYTLGKKSIIEVYEEVAFLFRNHHDLLLDFKNYLPDTSIGVKRSSKQPIHDGKRRKTEDNDATQFRSLKDNYEASCVEASLLSDVDCNGLKSNHDQEFAFFEKVKDRNSDVYRILMKYLELHNIEIITRSELQNMVDDLLEHYQELLEEFNDLFKSSEKNGYKDLNKNVAFGDDNLSPSKDTGKSIQELNFSKCEQITPSYRLLPADFPVAIPTGRTPPDKMVLNDHLICVSPGNGDFSRTQKKMSANEQFEDTRFEMDLLMERLKSTIGSANKLLELINKNTSGASDILRLEYYFTDQKMRCIEKLFGDWGLEVLDLLRDNPSRVLPIILNRLLQKRTELVQYREYIDKCAKNPQNIFRNEFGHEGSGERQSIYLNKSKENVSSSSIDYVVLDNDSLCISAQLVDVLG